MGPIQISLPETDMTPETWWLEDYFPFGMACFQGHCMWSRLSVSPPVIPVVAMFSPGPFLASFHIGFRNAAGNLRQANPDQKFTGRGWANGCVHSLPEGAGLSWKSGADNIYIETICHWVKGCKGLFGVSCVWFALQEGKTFAWKSNETACPNAWLESMPRFSSFINIERW